MQFGMIVLPLTTATASFKDIDLTCRALSIVIYWHRLPCHSESLLCTFLILLLNPSCLWTSGLFLQSGSILVLLLVLTRCEEIPDLRLTMGSPSRSALLLLSLCSSLPGCSLGESLPGAARAHGKYISNRHGKTCQNLAPGHRIVCSGRLSAPQAASWQ